MRPSTLAGYGTWTSPLTAARATAGSVRFDRLVLDQDNLYWVEGRASEAGRYVVVRRTSDGRIEDVTGPDVNVRTRVHEYGGGAFTVHRGVIYFSNFSDQRTYRQAAGEDPQPLTSEGHFYADHYVDARRGRLVCVREDHSSAGEPINTIATLALDGSFEHVLVSGADFYSNPAVSPDGSQFAWLQWRHPNMPWDGTELWVADLNADGSLGHHSKVAGGDRESIFQPEWSPDGVLYFVSDRTGFWNLYRRHQSGEKGTAQPATIEALYPLEADFGKPQWTFGTVSYAFVSTDRVAATYTSAGRWKLALLNLRTREFVGVETRLEPIDSIRATARDVYFIGGAPTEPMAIAQFTLATRELSVIRASTKDRLDRTWISAAEAVTFNSDGEPVHAFYYAPTNPDVSAPTGEKPPLLVLSHGGPTVGTIDVFDARIQFWTTRGFAVLDVNYRGSTGYGRAYRDRLKGEWGIVDVSDCVNGAKYLVAEGKADPDRLIIRGGSAGGYTTLAALTFHNVFKAGASYYGISDVEVLAHDTHKFESRYLDSLIGPYPATRDVYRERSPIHFTDRLSCALILFQGLEDKVVPPNQSEMMADAVRKKGLPVAYVPFAGEQHGFRKAENIIRSLEAELYFYGAVFGFTPADAIAPVQIDNL
jgi:dipeptidyl aminopeptidase/acylaminoacyl peptidase